MGESTEAGAATGWGIAAAPLNDAGRMGAAVHDGQHGHDPRRSGVFARQLPDTPEVILSRALSLAVSGVSSHRSVAKRLGCSATLVAQWCNETADKLPSARLLAALLCDPRSEVADELLRILVEMRAARPAPGLCVREHGLRVAEETGDVCRAVREAMLDGELDDEERRRIYDEAREGIEALQALQREVA